MTVGYTSYEKAKAATIKTIEKRLGRETEMMGYIASNLKFVYISDENYFMHQLEANVRKQQEQLAKDGMNAEFFYTRDGRIVPFKVSEKSAISFDANFFRKVTERKNNVFHATIAGVDYTISTKKINDLGGHFILAVETNSYLAPIHRMAHFTWYIMMTSFLASGIVVVIFVRGITKPLTILKNTMRKVREGNLTEKVSIRTKIPEIISLNKSFNMMMTQTAKVIKQLNETTDELEKTGTKLVVSSKSSLMFSNRLIDAMNIVKRGARETVESSENSGQYFQKMMHKIEVVMEIMTNVYDSSEDMKTSALIGNKQMAALIGAIHSLEKDFRGLKETIEQVRKNSVAITKLVALIEAIAEKTKLLALNAAIEASHAGRIRERICRRGARS